MHAHTPIHTHSQKHLTYWFWLTVCKALPCTDKQKISSDRYFSCRLTLGQRWALISRSMLTLPAYVGVSMPLWSCSLNTRAKCQESINACSIFTARLCSAFWVEMRTTCLVIYLRRWWNIHFSEKDIQLVPVYEAFVTIRLWYTLGEVQEGESATH